MVRGRRLRRGGEGAPRGGLGALSPLHGTATIAGRKVRSLWLDYLALVDVRAENASLHAQVRDLQDRAARAGDLAAENERLRRLLELGDRRKDLRLRAARVVARGTSPYFRVLSVTLDVGDGPVEEGMPVIAPGGVVGDKKPLFSGCRHQWWRLGIERRL